MLRHLAVLAVLAAGALGGSAAAQEAAPGRWYVHAGPGDVMLDEDASFVVGGAPLPGATITANNSWTPVVGVGYFVPPEFAVPFPGGLPPTAKAEAAGSIAGLGTVGEATYGPMALTAHYHFNQFGR